MARRGYHMMMAAPDPDAKPVDRATVRRVIGIFRPYRRKVAIVGEAIFVTSVIGVANPLLIKLIFDRALFGNAQHLCAGGVECPNLGLLYFYVGLMIAIPVASGIIGVGQTYLANVVGLRVMQDLRHSLYRHLQHMPLRFFTNTRTGEIQSRLTNDVGGIQSVVTDTASTILSNVVVILSTLIAMLVLSWQLTLLSLFMLPFFMWWQVRVGRARQAVVRNTQKSMADMTAITEETLSVSGILLSKAFGRQRFEIERFRGENERLAALQIRQQMITRAFFALIQIFFSITPALVYLVAGWVGAGRPGNPLTAGAIVVFTTLQSRLFFPLGSMLQVSVEIQSSMALFERIFEYLDMPHDITDAPDAVRLDPEGVRGTVRFRGVSFRYDSPPEGAAEDGQAAPEEVEPEVGAAEVRGVPERAAMALAEVSGNGQARREWTLREVDLEIEPGQLAALVGPSGAGKTTITYLVPRLYDVQEGSVEIDGVDGRKIGLASLGDLIGIVTQETYLFHDTVRRNLLYGRPDATQEELEVAATAAFIHERIAELPDGYDTVVGERGYKLSGGEKQRLAIARVVLKDPRILILDEATSSLDTTSERLVQEAL